jgi:hypothetical protein
MAQPRMITVRTTPRIHEAAKEAAWLAKKSLNEFCVDAILAAIPDLDRFNSPSVERDEPHPHDEGGF